VFVPFRKPNNTRGWVRASAVTLSSTTYGITVSFREHTLVLFNAGQPVLRTRVVGQCRGAYGAFAIGTSVKVTA